MYITTKEFFREATRLNIDGSDNKLVNYRLQSYISNAKGRVLSERFDNISNFVNGLAVCTKGDKKGIINSNGDLVIPLLYDNAYVDKNAIRICQKSKWGIASYSGRIRLKPTYPFIEAFNQNVSRFKSSDEKWGVIDIRGKIIIPAKYSYLGKIINKKLVARYKTYGVIDLQRNEIHPFKFKKMNIVNGVIILSDSYIKDDKEVIKIQ